MSKLTKEELYYIKGYAEAGQQLATAFQQYGYSAEVATAVLTQMTNSIERALAGDEEEKDTDE